VNKITNVKILRSDGETVNVTLQEANQAHLTALAKKVIIVNSLGTVIKLTRTRENLAGSAGTGSNGDTDRVYTLTTGNEVDIVEVYLDGVLLVETTDYTIDNVNKQVTMLSNTFDSQIVTIFYNC